MQESQGGIGKWIAWIVILGLIVWGLSSFMKKSSAVVETGPIKIGFIAPLSGDAASYGEPMQKSVELAVGEINKAGGIKGRMIEMVYEDGKCNGKDSASAAQKLVSVDKVKYIIGGFCSGEVFSQIPITDPAKVFSISPGASATKLSGISKYFVRNNPNDGVTGSVLADYLAKSYKTVAIISEQTDYAQGIKGNFSSEASVKGVKVVASEDFASNTTDFRSQLSKIIAAKPEAVFVNPQTPQNLARIIAQAKQLGLKVQLAGVLFGSDPTVQANKDADGIIFANLAGLTSAKGKDFMAKYKSTYGEDPNYPFYDGAGYDAPYLLAQAIASVGDDSTKVAQYVYSVKGFDGTLGTYSFDQNGDIVGAGVVLQKIANKGLVDL